MFNKLVLLLALSCCTVYGKPEDRIIITMDPNCYLYKTVKILETIDDEKVNELMNGIMKDINNTIIIMF